MTALTVVSEEVGLVEVTVNEPGPAGPTGSWDVGRAFMLRQLSLPIEDGTLRLDFAEANTFFVLLTETVSEIVFENLPPAGQSARVQVYVQQDEIGGHGFTGWPAGTCSAGGVAPILSVNPNTRDCLVLDTFEGAERVHVNLVGKDYALIQGI